MFFKKIKNNNRAIDVSVTGTAYIFILVLLVCGIVDFLIVSYGKVMVLTSLKECELYALAANFDFQHSFYMQDMELRDKVERSTLETFLGRWEGVKDRFNNFSNNRAVIVGSAGTEDSGVFVDIVVRGNIGHHRIQVPTVKFEPKKVLRNDSFMRFLGNRLSSNGYGATQVEATHSVARGGSVYTGAACKVVFWGQ